MDGPAGSYRTGGKDPRWAFGSLLAAADRLAAVACKHTAGIAGPSTALDTAEDTQGIDCKVDLGRRRAAACQVGALPGSQETRTDLEHTVEVELLPVQRGILPILVRGRQVQASWEKEQGI